MTFSRYSIIDAYTLEELRREYQGSDAKTRLRSLEKLYEDDNIPPYEIALLAVEDPSVEVRQWIARSGKCLDYRTRRYEGDKLIYEHPEKNLEDRLKNDSDPFVRACLRENPTISLLSSEWIGWFRESNHIERLALVRNQNVSDSLVERIFDFQDQELGLNLEDQPRISIGISDKC